VKDISLAQFCAKLAATELTITYKAFAIFLWHYDNENRQEMTAGEIAKIMHLHGLGNPNSSKLKESMSKTRLATRTGTSFRLKTSGRSQILKEVSANLKVQNPDINHEVGFLPAEIWKNTRGYLEKVCIQLNGCYEFNFPDAAAVLIRRIVETLLIEAFVQKRRETEIKNEDGNFFMLSGLIEKTLQDGGLELGRDTRKYLVQIKELGDRSAHKRNYNAVKADLDKIQMAVRVTADELINITNLKKQTR
jgi:hypothetical protein